jgi:hypothetical protein
MARLILPSYPIPSNPIQCVICADPCWPRRGCERGRGSMWPVILLMDPDNEERRGTTGAKILSNSSNFYIPHSFISFSFPAEQAHEIARAVCLDISLSVVPSRPVPSRCPPSRLLPTAVDGQAETQAHFNPTFRYIHHPPLPLLPLSSSPPIITIISINQARSASSPYSTRQPSPHPPLGFRTSDDGQTLKIPNMAYR